MTPLRFWACWLSLLVKMAGVAPLLALSPPRAVSMADAHGDSAAGSSVPDRKAVIDILLGRISLSGAWDPYATATAIGTSTQVRLGDSPFWADGSLIVAWGGELGPEGGRAGPGTSFVELQAGVGHRWSLESTPFTLYVGAGLTTIFANLELPDRSRAPLPNPYRPSEPIYPEISQDGYFWGGYCRGGFTVPVSGGWHAGCVVLGKQTTSRRLLDRYPNVRSIVFGILVGAGE